MDKPTPCSWNKGKNCTVIKCPPTCITKQNTVLQGRINRRLQVLAENRHVPKRNPQEPGIKKKRTTIPPIPGVKEKLINVEQFNLKRQAWGARPA